MENWKQRLYGAYVSSGQALTHAGDPESFDPSRYLYLTRMLQRVLPPRYNTRILDLACGHGPLLNCAKAMGYTQLAGVDVSAEQVALAHRLGLEQVVCMDLQAYLGPRQGAFDVVFAMDVLEHLTKPELLSCMDGVAASLASGGIVVIHVPNAEGLFGMRIRYGDLTHEAAFTAVSMTQLLRATGFTDIRCQEEKPYVHGLISAVRYVLWQVMTLPVRLLMAAETGGFRPLLSQNMLVVARKA